MSRVIAAVQARICSTRFPRKCFALLNGVPLLSHVLRRCLLMKNVKSCFLLVPAEEQSIFSDFLKKENLPVELFGGSSEDVLGRYAQAALYFGWKDPIMRVTGDNPFVSVFLADMLFCHFRGEGIAHYLGNPIGTGVEIFSVQDLLKCAKEAGDPYEREHCTPYFYRNPKLFTVSEPLCPVFVPNISATVDTPEDLLIVQALALKAPNWGIENFLLPEGFNIL